MKDWYACPDWCCSTFFEEKDHQTNSWSVQGRKIAQRGEGVTTMGGAVTRKRRSTEFPFAEALMSSLINFCRGIRNSSATDFCRAKTRNALQCCSACEAEEVECMLDFNGNVKPSWRKAAIKQDCNGDPFSCHFNKGRLERKYAINRKTLLKQHTAMRMLRSAMRMLRSVNMMLMVSMRTRMTGAESSGRKPV